jgi:hypothetical protein
VETHYVVEVLISGQSDTYPSTESFKVRKVVEVLRDVDDLLLKVVALTRSVIGRIRSRVVVGPLRRSE